jgi:hypothetical protein
VFRAAVLAFPWPVLQRFGDVSRGDLLLGGEIGDGAGQLQHPVVGAGREPHLAHGCAEHGLGGVVEGGMRAQLLRSRGGFERFYAERRATAPYAVNWGRKARWTCRYSSTMQRASEYDITNGWMVSALTAAAYDPITAASMVSRS